MVKLPVISGIDAIKAFSKIGWKPPGLLRKLIKDAGITPEEFIKLLD